MASVGDINPYSTLPIILFKFTMVLSTGTNNLGRDWSKILLNLNNRPVHRCAQLMLWSGIQWVNAKKSVFTGIKKICTITLIFVDLFTKTKFLIIIIVVMN